VPILPACPRHPASQTSRDEDADRPEVDGALRSRRPGIARDAPDTLEALDELGGGSNRELVGRGIHVDVHAAGGEILMLIEALNGFG